MVVLQVSVLALEGQCSPVSGSFEDLVPVVSVMQDIGTLKAAIMRVSCRGVILP